MNSGATASSPSEAPIRSNARLTTAEERDISKRLTPISVTPWRSSNSTEEPTTSSRRGSTLTRTPTAFKVRTRSSISPPSALVGATIARWTFSVRARSRISASRCTEKVLVDQVPTSSRSRCPTNSAFTPPCPASFERIVRAAAWSPMNRHRSAGRARSARARAVARTSTSSRISTSHSNSAWRRLSRSPWITKPPASHATSAPSVATWKSLGASSSVVLCSSTSSRSYSPITLAPSSSVNSPQTLTHVSCSDFPETAANTTKAPTIATTSAASSARRNSDSRERFSSRPRSSADRGSRAPVMRLRRRSSAVKPVCSGGASALGIASGNVISALLPMPPLIGRLPGARGSLTSYPQLLPASNGSPPSARIPMPNPRSESRIRLTASLRERTPSFPNAEERWLLTVLSDRNRRSAIWLFM